MGQLFRLVTATVLGALLILAIAVGLARQNAELLAPFHLLLFLILVAGYFIPSALALYRNCAATAWIVVVDLVFGWTLFGWVVALGWAARGRTIVPASKPAGPIHHVPGLG